MQNELDYIERAEHLERRKEIYEALYPETKVGSKGGWNNNKTQKLEKPDSGFSKKSFVTDTAEKTGRSESVIKEEIKIAKDVIPEVKKLLKSNDVSKNDALKIPTVCGWRFRNLLRYLLTSERSRNGIYPSRMLSQLVGKIIAITFTHF